MGGRHTKHSKLLLKIPIFIICIFHVVFQINDSPGPGSYDLSLKPQATSSIIKKDINPRATVTSRIPKKNVPGPQDYNPEINFMDEPSTFIDCAKKTYRGNKFGGQERKVFDASKEYTPGPGMYQVPSAFGVYMDRTAFSNLSYQGTSVGSTGKRGSAWKSDRSTKLAINP